MIEAREMILERWYTKTGEALVRGRDDKGFSMVLVRGVTDWCNNATAELANAHIEFLNNRLGSRDPVKDYELYVEAWYRSSVGVVELAKRLVENDERVRG